MSLPRRLTDQARFPHRGFARLGLCWLMLCLSVGGYLIFQSLSALGGSPNPPSVRSVDVRPVADFASSASYRSIEQIRVGQRVVTPGTDPSAPCPTAVDASTWKLLSLRLENRWPDGTLDVTEVKTLQPPGWVRQNHAAVGARVPLPLDLEEMGLPHEPAEVATVEACPNLEDKPGRVVLTTVHHLNAFLFDLKFRKPSGAEETVEVTGWHKLYSEDRRAWVSVCDLREGEALRGRDGPLTVASLVRHPGTFTVYNMTVEGEHVYYVSGLGLLAHNDGCTEINVDPNKYPESAQHLDDAGATNRPLTVNREGAVQNRRDALGGQPTVPGMDRDEAPPAVLRQPGDPVSVRPISPGDNRGAGSTIGHGLQGVPNGGQVIITTKPGPT